MTGVYLLDFAEVVAFNTFMLATVFLIGYSMVTFLPLYLAKFVDSVYQIALVPFKHNDEL